MKPPVSEPVIINIAGEGEVSGILNVNGDWLRSPGWFSSESGSTLAELEAQGHVFLLIPKMDDLPYADGSVDKVYTNGVGLDGISWLGPFPSTPEIWRVLKQDGEWLHNGEAQNRR